MSENKDLTTPGTTEIAVVPKSYIALMLEENRRGFLEANAGMDLDYVRMGDWLKISKKGNFVESADEDVSFGDVLDVVVGLGEQRWMLWGKKGTPEDGQLITAEKTQAEAEEAFNAWINENPMAAANYNVDDIKLRYLAFIVPIKEIEESAAAGEIPKVYMISFAPGDTFGWGTYVRNIYNGKFKALGVPSKSGVNRVVTRFTTEERKNGNESWIGIKFDCIGMFNPADYGIEQ